MDFGPALWWACLAAEALSLALAVVLARGASSSSGKSGPNYSKVLHVRGTTWTRLRAHPHAPIVALLAFAVLEDVAVRFLTDGLIAGAPRPLAGVHRAAFHLATALVMAWPAMLAGTCWRVFAWPLPARRFGDVLLGCWSGVVVGLAVAHPLDPPGTGAPRARAVLHVWELACVLACGWAVARAWRRPWGRANVALVVLAAVEAVVAVLGPYGNDVFKSWEVLARVPYCLGFGTLAAVQVGWIVSSTARR